MAELSNVKREDHLPVQIRIHPFLRDHRINGQGIFPAVEAMRLLAGMLRKYFPEVAGDFISDASFPKFLPLPESEQTIDAFVQFQQKDARTLVSTLFTKIKTKSGIIRSQTHAILSFEIGSVRSPFEIADDLNGDDEPVDHLSPDAIYKNWIPFGKSFRNLNEMVKIYRNGAYASVSGGETAPEESALGSIFPLDAAFHAACAWGKGMHDTVIFPIGFEKRRIVNPTCFCENYSAKVVFKAQENGEFRFDIGIYDDNGRPRELISGVRMKNIP